jgi:hypothetical protein
LDRCLRFPWWIELASCPRAEMHRVLVAAAGRDSMWRFADACRAGRNQNKGNPQAIDIPAV